MRNRQMCLRVFFVLGSTCFAAVFLNAPSYAAVIYTETFTAANQSSSSVINADNTWTVTTGTAELSGNAMIGGPSLSVMIDEGTDLALDHTTDTVTIQGDVTVTTLNSGSIVNLIVVSPNETGAPLYQVSLYMMSGIPPVAAAARDNSSLDLQQFGTADTLVLGTTYRVTASFTPNGSTTDVEVSLEAIAGPGSDLFAGLTDTLSVGIAGTAGPYNPTILCPSNAATYSLDNYVVSANGSASMPAVSGVGLALACALTIAMVCARRNWMKQRAVDLS
ncbi:MAG: hypothetical protein HUU46_10755 [Candidatus Hydrogenedentes bacterium]|nr:hypothetical protein [Candidatus Hydrogenedentota bacterium]